MLKPEQNDLPTRPGRPLRWGGGCPLSAEEVTAMRNGAGPHVIYEPVREWWSRRPLPSGRISTVTFFEFHLVPCWLCIQAARDGGART
jgi:hypothetical protein